jgi:hypothetical protein
VSERLRVLFREEGVTFQRLKNLEVLERPAVRGEEGPDRPAVRDRRPRGAAAVAAGRGHPSRTGTTPRHLAWTSRTGRQGRSRRSWCHDSMRAALIYLHTSGGVHRDQRLPRAGRRDRRRLVGELLRSAPCTRPRRHHRRHRFPPPREQKFPTLARQSPARGAGGRRAASGGLVGRQAGHLPQKAQYFGVEIFGDLRCGRVVVNGELADH